MKAFGKLSFVSGTLPRAARVAVCAAVLLAGVSFSRHALNAQSSAAAGEWLAYGSDLANTRYSPLSQINAENFKTLQVAWRFKTDNLGPSKEFLYEVTPLMAKGMLYATGGSRRAVFALDAATGELRWVYGLNEGKRGSSAPRQLSGRGLSYWTDGREERIIYVTPGYQMIALNAKTGQPIPAFGKGGIIDLKQEADQQIDLETGEIGLHATPAVTKDVIIVGAAFRSGGVPKSKTNVKGYVRAYDVRTGKRLWIFHTIPRPGEFGNDTWDADSWSYTGNTGVWAQISVDEDLGLAYLPVEAPTGDYFGANRPGANLFAESIVAVDLKTGKRKWHYQLVHHPIWDHDIPCAPILIDITMNGRTIKALAQPTKQSLLYVFNRETGEPIWPMEERPAPKGDVPGEWYSPTQPFPTKPAPFGRTGVTVDDLIDFTPELRQQAIEVAKKYKMGPLFTPPVVSDINGPIATLYAHGSGGANWPGGSYDPETHRLYVSSQHNISTLSLVPAPPELSEMAYIQGNALAGARRTAGTGSAAGGGQRVIAPPPGTTAPPAPEPPAGDSGGGLNVSGLPLGKPPYGRITAYDMDKGEILWQVAHGETPDNIRNNPALKGLNIPRTGRSGQVGTLVTKTVVIAGEQGIVTTPFGRGAMMRAYDKATGQEVGAVYLPAPESGSSMTYMADGKQYIVIAVSGGNYSGELIAFKLP